MIFEYVSCHTIVKKIYQTDIHWNSGPFEETGAFTDSSINIIIILNWRPKMHSNLLFHGMIQRQCLSTENNQVGFKNQFKFSSDL